MLMDLVAAAGQPRRSLVPVPAQPRVHTLAAHSVPVGHLGHRNPGRDFQQRPGISARTRSAPTT